MSRAATTEFTHNDDLYADVVEKTRTMLNGNVQSRIDGAEIVAFLSRLDLQ